MGVGFGLGHRRHYRSSQREILVRQSGRLGAMNARLIDSTSVPLRREFLATFSKRAQMILFRVAKCALRLTWVGVFRREPAFWWRLPAMAPFGFALHFQSQSRAASS